MRSLTTGDALIAILHEFRWAAKEVCEDPSIDLREQFQMRLKELRQMELDDGRVVPDVLEQCIKRNSSEELGP